MKIYKSNITCLLFSIIMSWQSCKDTSSANNEAKGNQKGSPSIEAHNTDKGEKVMQSKAGYYYEMGAQEIAQLKANMVKVQLGDSREKVRQLLGTPTDEKKLAKKDINDSWFEWKMEYYVKIWEKGLVNEKYDKSVNLFFNKNDQLIEVVSNVDGIDNKK